MVEQRSVYIGLVLYSPDVSIGHIRFILRFKDYTFNGVYYHLIFDVDLVADVVYVNY